MAKTMFSSDPEIQGGAICFDGTRVPFEAIANFIRAGYDNETIWKEYPSLKMLQIQGARNAIQGGPARNADPA